MPAPPLGPVPPAKPQPQSRRSARSAPALDSGRSGQPQGARVLNSSPRGSAAASARLGDAAPGARTQKPRVPRESQGRGNPGGELRGAQPGRSQGRRLQNFDPSLGHRTAALHGLLGTVGARDLRLTGSAGRHSDVTCSALPVGTHRPPELPRRRCSKHCLCSSQPQRYPPPQRPEARRSRLRLLQRPERSRDASTRADSLGRDCGARSSRGPIGQSRSQ